MLLCYVFFEISDRNSGNELGTQWVPGVNCRAGKERVSGAFGIFWCSLSGTDCLVLFREAECFSGQDFPECAGDADSDGSETPTLLSGNMMMLHDGLCEVRIIIHSGRRFSDFVG